MENLLENQGENRDDNSVVPNAEEAFFPILPISDVNDYNHEFAYEDFEKMTGKSYLSYLRFYDDMS